MIKNMLCERVLKQSNKRGSEGRAGCTEQGQVDSVVVTWQFQVEDHGLHSSLTSSS